MIPIIMELLKNWSQIRKHFRESFTTNLHVSIATVGALQSPDVTPIGTFFLNREQATGFYFEKYATTIASHFENTTNVCVLAVNSNRWFWIYSLFSNRFKKHPAIKLYGQLGERRLATEEELKRLRRRMKRTRMLKGHQYLWSTMAYVRPISFTHASKMKLGKMTQLL